MTTIASAAPSAKAPSQAITIAVDEFPPVLNNMTTAGNGAWTAMIAGPALARGYKLLPDFSYEPWIFDKDCTVVEQSPFTVDCTIRPEAKWSDGVPITSNDFKFTYDTIMNTKNDVVTARRLRQDHRVQRAQPDRVPDGVPGGVRARTASSGRARARPCSPQHILEGKNFNKVWNTCICDPKTKKPISSGPMMVRVVHVRSSRPRSCPTRTTGAARSHRCRKVVFVPVRDTNSELNAFRSGEVDVIYPQNQIGLRKKIESVDGAEYTTTLGPQWEHFDMLSTVARARRPPGAQGDRHRDAAPADRRPRREGRQRRRRKC